MNALIVGRVLAGVGGTGIYVGVMTLLSVNTVPRERPWYLSFVGLFWGIGTVLGPVIGGAFAQSKATWRWAFYINLLVGAVFAPVYLFLIPSYYPRGDGDEKTAAARFRVLKDFDVVGTILSVGAITALIMAINLGGALYAWKSAQIIALFVVAFALFIILGFQQVYCLGTRPTTRLFPVHFLRNWNAVLLFATAAASNTAGFVPIYYLPLYFQFSRGDDSIQAAVRLLPLIFVICATILMNGHLMARLSYFQPWYVVGSAVALVGAVLMCQFVPPQLEVTFWPRILVFERGEKKPPEEKKQE
jgi:MFS family permease